jgi:anti-sigma28 factor (negative regulator of flagellin synthesis)
MACWEVKGTLVFETGTAQGTAKLEGNSVTSSRVQFESLSFDRRLQELQRLKESIADGTYAVPIEKVVTSVIEQMLSAIAPNKVRYG